MHLTVKHVEFLGRRFEVSKGLESSCIDNLCLLRIAAHVDLALGSDHLKTGLFLLGITCAQSFGEEAAQLTLRRGFAVHVRVSDHLVESEAALGVIAQHARDEVLQVLWRCEGAAVARRNLDTVLPEEVRTTVVDMLKHGVRFDTLAFSDGNSSQNHEKDTTKREDVCLEGVVGLAEANLWSHVARGANVSLEIAFNIDCFSRAEVSNLNCEVLIQQNILHF